MKNKFVFIVFCFYYSFSFSQEKREIRTLDWQNFNKSIQTTTIASPVSYGNFAVFEIKNINKYLFKVEIQGEKVSLQTPIPSELQKLFRLDKKQVDELLGNSNEEVEEAKGTLNGALEKMEALKLGIESTLSADLGNQKKSKVREIKKAESEKEFLEEKKEKAVTLKAKEDEIKKIEDEIDEKEAIINSLKSEENKIDLVIKNKQKIDEFKISVDNVLSKCKTYIEKVQETADILLKLKIARRQLIVYSQEDLGFADMKVKVEKVNFPNDLIAESKYQEFIKSYNEVEVLYKKAILKATLDENGLDTKSIVKEALEEIETGHKIITEEQLLDLLEQVTQLYEGLQNERNFTVVAPPVQMNEDVASYVVSITPTSTRTLEAFKNPINFNFDIPTKGGLKVDFSVGPILSFGFESKDHKFYFDGTGTSATLKRIQNQNAISPSIAAMMHFYNRTGRTRSLGGVFGVGAGFQGVSDVNLSIITGISSVLGKREKIMLNGGISWLKVERLKIEKYQLGKYYDVNPDDVTEKVFRPSLFFSISYNLTNRLSRD